jgi:hypothetical protein
MLVGDGFGEDVKWLFKVGVVLDPCVRAMQESVRNACLGVARTMAVSRATHGTSEKRME